MNDTKALLKLLKGQMENDYYKNGMTLPQIYKKYKRFTHKDIIDVLGLYDLASEPVRQVIAVRFAREWERECKRLNPRAWEGR